MTSEPPRIPGLTDTEQSRWQRSIQRLANGAIVVWLSLLAGLTVLAMRHPCWWSLLLLAAAALWFAAFLFGPRHTIATLPLTVPINRYYLLSRWITDSPIIEPAAGLPEEVAEEVAARWTKAGEEAEALGYRFKGLWKVHGITPDEVVMFMAGYEHPSKPQVIALHLYSTTYRHARARPMVSVSVVWPDGARTMLAGNEGVAPLPSDSANGARLPADCSVAEFEKGFERYLAGRPELARTRPVRFTSWESMIREGVRRSVRDWSERGWIEPADEPGRHRYTSSGAWRGAIRTTAPLSRLWSNAHRRRAARLARRLGLR